MPHKAVAIRHDGKEDRVVEYPTKEAAVYAAIQFAHGVGIKDVHVLDENDKKVWSPEGESEPDKQDQGGKDQRVLNPALVKEPPPDKPVSEAALSRQPPGKR